MQDIASSTYPPSNTQAKLKWKVFFDADDPSLTQQKTPDQYFRMMFPTQILNDILRWTSINIRQDESVDTVGGDVTSSEFSTFLGIQYRMMLLGCANIDEYFRTREVPDSAYPPLSFGKKFGMPKHRFETLRRNLQCCEKPKKAATVSYNIVVFFVFEYECNAVVTFNSLLLLLVDTKENKLKMPLLMCSGEFDPSLQPSMNDDSKLFKWVNTLLSTRVYRFGTGRRVFR